MSVAPDRGDWRPAASPARLRLRARLKSRIRLFFQQRDVLEVDTPALSTAAPTDPHIHSLVVEPAGGGTTWYLQTSPEFPMKRLVAAGLGDCWQLARVFRDGERGRLHHPEFELLEWYRVGFDHQDLMREVEDLVRFVVAPERAVPSAAHCGYRDAFVRYAGIDPVEADLTALQDAAQRAAVDVTGIDGGDRDAWCDLLFGAVVVPALPADRPLFIDRWPASQAALARLADDDERVACRFELFWQGVELANGFYELTDPTEQRRRFEADLHRREATGQGVVPRDERLLSALVAGLPDCAGVALGFDRMTMLAAYADTLDAVIAFPPGSN